MPKEPITPPQNDAENEAYADYTNESASTGSVDYSTPDWAADISGPSDSDSSSDSDNS